MLRIEKIANYNMGNVLCCNNSNQMNYSGSNSQLALAPHPNDSPETRAQRINNVRRLDIRKLKKPSNYQTSPLARQDSAQDLGLVQSTPSPHGTDGISKKRRLTYNEIDLEQYDIAFVL